VYPPPPPPAAAALHVNCRLGEARSILAREGPRGLYRGLTPELCKIVPMVGGAFSTCASYLCSVHVPRAISLMLGLQGALVQLTLTHSQPQTLLSFVDSN